MIDRQNWDGLTDRVERNCDLILAMFSEADVKATFPRAIGEAASREAIPQILALAKDEIAQHCAKSKPLIKLIDAIAARER